MEQVATLKLRGQELLKSGLKQINLEEELGIYDINNQIMDNLVEEVKAEHKAKYPEWTLSINRLYGDVYSSVSRTVKNFIGIKRFEERQLSVRSAMMASVEIQKLEDYMDKVIPDKVMDAISKAKSDFNLSLDSIYVASVSFKHIPDPIVFYRMQTPNGLRDLFIAKWE